MHCLSLCVSVCLCVSLCVHIDGRGRYYQLYEHAARAIKSVDKRLQVGGPTTCCCAAWITEFKEYCSSREVPIDFISTHAYTGGNENINSVSSVTSVLQQAKAKADPIPLVITEFGSSYIPGTGNFTTGTSHDDYDAASFLVKLFTEAQGIAEVLSYWSISDVFEEAGMPAVNASFNGDFGLVNIFGVPKPGYRVLQLMHEAGTERINSTVRGSGTCAHTVGALALAGNGSGTAFSVLLYSQSARGGAIEDSCSVTLKLRLSSELSSHRSQPQTVECTVRRIDGDHANPSVNTHTRRAFRSTCTRPVQSDTAFARSQAKEMDRARHATVALAGAKRSDTRSFRAS